MTVRRISSLPDGFEVLVVESVAEGFGHLARLREEWADSSNRFDRPGEGLFAAWDGDDLVGVGGVNQDPFADADEHAGRVRRLYVSGTCRGQGHGAALLAAIEQHAAGTFSILTVFAPDDAAVAFYETHGFDRVGTTRRRSHQKAIQPVG